MLEHYQLLREAESSLRLGMLPEPEEMIALLREMVTEIKSLKARVNELERCGYD